VVIDIFAVVLLAGAMVYGSAMWRRRPRDPATKPASDDATAELYHHFALEALSRLIGNSHIGTLPRMN
jgi:hypothetical protein